MVMKFRVTQIIVVVITLKRSCKFIML